MDTAIALPENRVNGYLSTTPPPPPVLAPRPAQSIVVDVDSATRAMESLQAISSFIGSQLVEGVDYLRIPGVDRPSLAQPGAEKIALLLGAYFSHDIRETELGDSHLEVKVVARLISHVTGATIAEGIGSCTTMESRYRYRDGKRRCPSCDSEALRRAKDRDEWYCWAKQGGCGARFDGGDRAITNQHVGKVETPDIADTRNTVRKMAAKRAMVDATKRAACVSGKFTQDVEDLDLEARHAAPAPAPPARRPTPDRSEPRADRPASAPRPDSTGGRPTPPGAQPRPGAHLWWAISQVQARHGQVVMERMTAFAQARGYPPKFMSWTADQVADGEAELARIDDSLSRPAPAPDRPPARSVRARRRLLDGRPPTRRDPSPPGEPLPP